MRKLLWVALAVLAFGTTSGCVIDDTYSYCDGDADCADLDDVCFFVALGGAGTSGSFCSHTCTSHLNCESSGGFPGACYNLDATLPLCYQTCIDDFDCFASSVYIDVLDSAGFVVDAVCVPDN